MRVVVHSGGKSQVGRGFPFKHLFKRYVKPGLNYLGDEALQTGLNVGKDVLGGVNVKDSITKQIGKSKKRILRKILTGGKRNSSKKTRKRSKKMSQPKKGIKRRLKKVKKTDIFGK